MFEFFKSKKENKDLDAKSLRDQILQFIKEELQRLDGGEGKGLSVLQLFIDAEEDNLFLYETALYVAEPGKFQEEIQRIADNYALGLPDSWHLEVLFADELPVGAIRSTQVKAGLSFKRAAVVENNVSETGQGRITVLKGHAEQQEYLLNAVAGRINIGREKNIQANDGSFRINSIAFPEGPAFESNKYISRQHAHIEWDEQSAQFKLYADEGGVPPGNKTKIRSALNESLQKLNSTHIGYPLANGDQVILGDAAVLEFTIALKQL